MVEVHRSRGGTLGALAAPARICREDATAQGELVRLRLTLLYSLQFRLSQAGRRQREKGLNHATGDEHLTIEEYRRQEERLDAITLGALADIDAAFERITLGTYGRCTECGAEIPDERLGILPETPVCDDCHQRRPSDGADSIMWDTAA